MKIQGFSHSLLVALLCSAFHTLAQSPPGGTGGLAHAPGWTNPPPPLIVERGDHHKVLQWFTPVLARNGSTALQSHTLTVFDSPAAAALPPARTRTPCPGSRRSSNAAPITKSSRPSPR